MAVVSAALICYYLIAFHADFAPGRLTAGGASESVNCGPEGPDRAGLRRSGPSQGGTRDLAWRRYVTDGGRAAARRRRRRRARA